MSPNELTLVEKPIGRFMQSMGYRVVGKDKHGAMRRRENEVLFKPLLIKALRDLNDRRRRRIPTNQRFRRGPRGRQRYMSPNV